MDAQPLGILQRSQDGDAAKGEKTTTKKKKVPAANSETRRRFPFFVPINQSRHPSIYLSIFYIYVEVLC